MEAPRDQPPPPEAWAPALRLVRLATRPLERFLQVEAAGGLCLVVVAAVALAWANSPAAHAYHALWHTRVTLRVGALEATRTLHWLVNDGLMTVFFFVAGMEIRRELAHGELSVPRRAALPVAAALGGMICPALLFAALAPAAPERAGWGVPMATDIAFAVGVLRLLGKRVPPALRVLLLALAIIDDLGAIVVIALFYSQGISLPGLGVAALGAVGVLGLQASGVRQPLAYVPAGLVVWLGAMRAGVHPTIAGVAVGMLTPVRAWIDESDFLRDARAALDALDAGRDLDAHARARLLRDVERARRETQSPAERLIAALHPWVAFGIMPLFALANAGVSVGAVSLSGAPGRAAAGAFVGLLVGKPVGVALACALAVKLRVAALPEGLTARHVGVLGLVAGIGFTMSLFVAELAYTDAALLASTRGAVLAASTAAAVVGLAVGAAALRPTTVGAESADEAESSTER